MKSKILRELTEKYGVRYSEKFHIDLKREPFKWFLLATFFGARISKSLALRTYKIFEIYNVTSPQRILEEGWDSLVALLDSGGYTRYDFKTANKLLELAKSLSRKDMNQIHEEAMDFEDLVKKLKSLARGIGDTTVGIFLREMVGVWEKARPYPTPLAKMAARNLGIHNIEDFWRDEMSDLDYAKFESMLVEIGKLCRQGKCEKCPARKLCEGMR